MGQPPDVLLAWQLEQRDREVAALKQQLSFLQQEVVHTSSAAASLADRVAVPASDPS